VSYPAANFRLLQWAPVGLERFLELLMAPVPRWIPAVLVAGAAALVRCSATRQARRRGICHTAAAQDPQRARSAAMAGDVEHRVEHSRERRIAPRVSPRLGRTIGRCRTRQGERQGQSRRRGSGDAAGRTNGDDRRRRSDKVTPARRPKDA